MKVGAIIAALGVGLVALFSWRSGLIRQFRQPVTTNSTAPSDTLPSGTSLPTGNTPIHGADPFGVMFGSAEKVPAAKSLNAVYYRPAAISLDTWNGWCAECEAALNQHLSLILTIRNNGGKQQPTTPPTDWDAFKQKIGAVIETYHPMMLVVENEENSQALFYQGTPEQYHQELQAACEVAHEKGITCANGGLVSSLVALLTGYAYYQQGQEAQAQTYVHAALGTKFPEINGKSPAQVFATPSIKKQIERGLALLAGYRSDKTDYVNFHWYSDSPEALKESVTYLKNTTGLPVITNEIGQQQNENPEQVTQMMAMIKTLKVPVAIWFSVDVTDFGGARSLINTDGSLRPNGQAFSQFIRQNYTD